MPDFSIPTIESLNEYLWNLYSLGEIKINKGPRFIAEWDRFEDAGDYPSGAGGKALPPGPWEISRVDGSCFVVFSVPFNWVKMDDEVVFKLDDEEDLLTFKEVIDENEDLDTELWEDLIDLVDLNVPKYGEYENNLRSDFDIVYGKSAKVKKGDEAEITIEVKLEYRK